MASQKTIRRTQTTIIVAGIATVALGVATNPGVGIIGGLVWIAFGNLLLAKLRCTYCGRMLMTVPPMFFRAFGLSKCAHCQREQPVE